MHLIFFGSSVFPSCFQASTHFHIEIPSLALINRAGGLYGRILTEVVSTDRTQWSLYTRPRSGFSHTDRLSSVNKMFIIWRKQEQFNSFNVTGFVLTAILLANGDEPNLILPKFARPLYFFFLISFLALAEINIVRWKQSIILHCSLQLFHFKTLLL